MKKPILILTILFPIFIFGQDISKPRNLKQAVLILDQTTSDSIRELISGCGNDSILEISYPWGGGFKTIFNWTDRDYSSKLISYLDKKGVSNNKHQIKVILIAFKESLNNDSYSEDEILKPFQELEIEWNEEDKIRNNTDSLRGEYIPKDLPDCFKQIDSFWDDSTKIMVKNWTEDEFIGNAHFGFGMWMRNNWQLWGGSRLSIYFNEMGVFHPDDMSGIILRTYHRYLNNQDTELKKLIRKYDSYWTEREKENQKRYREKYEENKEEFNELQIGDSLEYMYNFGYTSREQENSWIEDSCIVAGILIGKHESELLIRVQVTETCDKKGIIYYTNLDGLKYEVETDSWSNSKKSKQKYLKKGRSAWFRLEDWYKDY